MTADVQHFKTCYGLDNFMACGASSTSWFSRNVKETQCVRCKQTQDYRLAVENPIAFGIAAAWSHLRVYPVRYTFEVNDTWVDVKSQLAELR